MRDENYQMKQEQDEHQQWLIEQTQKKLTAMSDDEFFKYLGLINKEVDKHVCS